MLHVYAMYFVGKDSSHNVSLSEQLPVVNSTLDLGIAITHHLTPCMHIKNIVAKAHFMRANAIHYRFVSKDKLSLLRAFLVYVRLLLEHNSVVWSPYLKQYILSIEHVQRQGGLRKVYMVLNT